MRMVILFLLSSIKKPNYGLDIKNLRSIYSISINTSFFFKKPGIKGGL